MHHCPALIFRHMGTEFGGCSFGLHWGVIGESIKFGQEIISYMYKAHHLTICFPASLLGPEL
jgi:hypothetical protein